MAATFDFDAAIREADGEPFAFTFQGEAHRLPPFSSIPADQLFDALDGGPSAQLAVIRSHLGDVGGKVFAAPVGAVNKLFEAWMEHSGLDAGEPAASSS